MKFVSWNDNEKVVYIRNDKYWQAGQPLLDGIEMQIIAETNTGLRSVVAGQNDFVYFLAPQQKQIIDRAKSLTAVTGPTLYCIQLFLNYGRPPLDNPKVRLAINHAIDRRDLQQGHDGRDCGNCLDGVAHGALGLRSEAGQCLAV